MSNIKNISKELTGKTLNSLHKKVDLKSIEKNNEMQDGILDGILSQIDNAYISNTEESNVIHLDGSGDGVVVVDSIEGNSLVNLFDENYIKQETTYVNDSDVIIGTASIVPKNLNIFQIGKTYTLIPRFKITKTVNNPNPYFTINCMATNGKAKSLFTTHTKDINDIVVVTIPNDYSYTTQLFIGIGANSEITLQNVGITILEGDWTNKEIPPYFEGMQSSFEEKKVGDKYEVDVECVNKNLYDKETMSTSWWVNQSGVHKDETKVNYSIMVPVKNNSTYKLSCSEPHDRQWYALLDRNYNTLTSGSSTTTITNTVNAKYLLYYMNSTGLQNLSNIQLEFGYEATRYTPHKSNKLKIHLNEPLRGIGDVKDRLCVKDGKLVVERKCGYVVLDGSEQTWGVSICANGEKYFVRHDYDNSPIVIGTNLLQNQKWDKFALANPYMGDRECAWIFKAENTNYNTIRIKLNSIPQTPAGISQWLQQNPVKVIYQLAEPFYEEVVNEFGQPILLEGYESGTLYIDSVITPTTSVRYTPKMKSFNVIKEVNANNNVLTDDINENIIPYMMEVDMAIMEKEMAMPQILNRKMEVLDMTSMQKRTKEMLERLIRGKSLTEQECKDRVVIYLDAKKITSEQAEELMLIIAEVYA